MHVDNDRVMNRTKMVAALGVMAAVSVILLVLGSLISVNTVFFTALASFLVGIAVVRYGFSAGTMLFLGSALLDFLLNPDKFHVFLYLAMGGFILLGEGSYKILEKKVWNPKTRNGIHLICRIVVFAAGFIPLVILLPQLFLAQEVWQEVYEFSWFTWILIGVGVAAFIVFDLAYLFVKRVYMRLFRF